MRRFLFFLVLSFFLVPAALAHGGRTDGMGGHYDNSTGEYHFHHGHPAHHHPGGVCPYDSSRLYPTDPPSRATQTTRPSSSSSFTTRLSPSSKSYGWFERATATSTPRPTATPAPTPAPGGMNQIPGMVFVFGGTAAAFAFIAWHVSHAHKAKPVKTIMTAKPGETFHMEHGPAVTAPSAKPQPVFPSPAVSASVAVTPADPRLLKVEIVNGYHVRILFSNGETRYFDFLFLLLEERYAILSDYSLFTDFYIPTSHMLLCWRFGVSIPAKRLYQESSPTPTVTVTDRTLPF